MVLWVVFMECSPDQSCSEYKHGLQEASSWGSTMYRQDFSCCRHFVNMWVGARLRELDAPQHPLPSLRLLIFSLVSFLKTNISEKFTDLGNSEKVHSKWETGHVECSVVTDHHVELSIGTTLAFQQVFADDQP